MDVLVGRLVGHCVGSELGSPVGSVLGSQVGSVLGNTDGSVLGNSDGSVLGRLLGNCPNRSAKAKKGWQRSCCSATAALRPVKESCITLR